MADDITLPGTSKVVATDEVSARHYQRVKLDIGGDGATSPVTSTNPMPVDTGVAATGNAASVASTAADTTILAVNVSRKGATVSNDDANILYLLLANATSSLTNYTVQIPTGGYFEVPYRYTGVIKGIWAADGSGAARVTEFT